MRSIHLKDKASSHNETSERAKLFMVEPETHELNNKGFLTISIIMLLIYAMAFRPVLYERLFDWLIQLYSIRLIITSGGIKVIM